MAFEFGWLPSIYQAGAKLQRVAQAKDLGVCFRFSKSASLAKGEPRLAEGLHSYPDGGLAAVFLRPGGSRT